MWLASRAHTKLSPVTSLTAGLTASPAGTAASDCSAWPAAAATSSGRRLEPQQAIRVPPSASPHTKLFSAASEEKVRSVSSSNSWVLLPPPLPVPAPSAAGRYAPASSSGASPQQTTLPLCGQAGSPAEQPYAAGGAGSGVVTDVTSSIEL